MAAAVTIGPVFSLMPENMTSGMVFWAGAVTKEATTTSSSEMAKAKTAPVRTPGRMIGSMTRRKAVTGEAPSDAAARQRLLSKPCKAESTLMTTKGRPSMVCRKMAAQ